MLTTGVLLACLAAAAWTDLARQRIPNALTYPGMIALLICRGIEGGASGLEDAVKGFLACGGIMVVCLVFFNIGGGDVKLLALMGLGLGFHDGMEGLLWTFTIGFAWGVCVLIWRIGALRIVRGLFRQVRLMLIARGWVPLSDEQRQPMQRWLGLAPAALAAAVVVRWDFLANGM